MLKRIPPPTTRIQSSLPNPSANRHLQLRHSSAVPRVHQNFSPSYVFTPSDMTQHCWKIGQGVAVPHPSIPIKIMLQ